MSIFYKDVKIFMPKRCLIILFNVLIRCSVACYQLPQVQPQETIDPFLIYNYVIIKYIFIRSIVLSRQTLICITSMKITELCQNYVEVDKTSNIFKRLLSNLIYILISNQIQCLTKFRESSLMKMDSFT